MKNFCYLCSTSFSEKWFTIENKTFCEDCKNEIFSCKEIMDVKEIDFFKNKNV